MLVHLPVQPTKRTVRVTQSVIVTTDQCGDWVDLGYASPRTGLSGTAILRLIQDDHLGAYYAGTGGRAIHTPASEPDAL